MAQNSPRRPGTLQHRTGRSWTHCDGPLLLESSCCPMCPGQGHRRN